ncbi:MAG: selenide, water dikinase [Erysipelotrichia bacterium]|nr:selenide, water dikinase [Erysipelotrichia bacterium]
MDTVMKILSDIRVVIAIAVVVVLLLIWFIVQKVQAGKYKRQLGDLEVRYNAIKSVPLSFKLNKAVAISRVDPDAMDKVTKTKDDFDKCQANLKQISQMLADTEDEILVGKLKPAKANLADLDASIGLGESQVSKLDKFLDTILEKETTQREEVTELKNQFRDLKANAQENSQRLSYIWPTIESNISDTEKMFSAFEEWMYASDFEKASAELANIKQSMLKLQEITADLPTLLEDARGVVPRMAEVLHKDYVDAHEHGVYLKHLQIEKNLTVLTEGLKQDLEQLKNGDPTDVRIHLDDYKKRLAQMDEQVKRESESFDQLKNYELETDRLLADTQGNAQYVKNQYGKMNERFGLENLDQEIDKNTALLQKLSDQKPQIYRMYQDHQRPASEVLSCLKELNQGLTDCNNAFNEMKGRIDHATGDEDRAKKQLIKLQIIMNQMQVKIRKYKLPSISAQYEEDMNRANEYIHSLESLIKESPLNIPLLNSTLKEAIDFIYKLYNNVNNVVATVSMVENTVVFGNRYRSTYADIDSELTRSELCFRNGEYTQALTIAIGTIEKIHPGNYEKMIKENAKSA